MEQAATDPAAPPRGIDRTARTELALPIGRVDPVDADRPDHSPVALGHEDVAHRVEGVRRAAELAGQVADAEALPHPVGREVAVREPNDLRNVGLTGIGPDDESGKPGRRSGRIGLHRGSSVHQPTRLSLPVRFA
jgi:hypothetical protein